MSEFEYIGKRQKPLCVCEDGLITYKKSKLYLYDGNKFNKLYSFSSDLIFRIKESTRLTERIFRCEPQCALCHSNSLFVARRNSIDEINLQTKTLLNTFHYREDYIHTNRITKLEGVNGFFDSIVYGEYFANTKKESVRIYQKKYDENEFTAVFEFAPGRVRHIHSIIPNPKDECVYILTGDSDSESGIWVAKNNFGSVEPLLVGDQKYRSCICFLTDNGFVYATDTPERENMIFGYDAEEKSFSKIFDIKVLAKSLISSSDILLILLNLPSLFSLFVKYNNENSRKPKNRFLWFLIALGGLFFNSSDVLEKNDKKNIFFYQINYVFHIIMIFVNNMS